MTDWEEWEEQMNRYGLPIAPLVRKNIEALRQLKELGEAESHELIDSGTAAKCAWAIYESVKSEEEQDG